MNPRKATDHVELRVSSNPVHHQRKLKEITKQQLADRANCSLDAVRQAEAAGFATKSVVEKLAAALEIDKRDLDLELLVWRTHWGL
ncbi:MAG: hypothetical protein AAF581_05910 [Planctomycetota bacterium]